MIKYLAISLVVLSLSACGEEPSVLSKKLPEGCYLSFLGYASRGATASDPIWIVRCKNNSVDTTIYKVNKGKVVQTIVVANIGD